MILLIIVAALLLAAVILILANRRKKEKPMPVTTVKPVELIRTDRSWDGAVLPDYPQGRPELAAVRIEFPAGQKLGWHHHPVMNYGILTQGELTIVSRDGQEKTVHAGEALVKWLTPSIAAKTGAPRLPSSTCSTSRRKASPSPSSTRKSPCNRSPLCGGARGVLPSMNSRCVSTSNEKSSAWAELFCWRCVAESNHCDRFCRPAPSHSANAPFKGKAKIRLFPGNTNFCSLEKEKYL